ncbi:unnamed protein product [Caenorhabditis angaria]|uniref:Uncharacterized protein n=1 Tax=Caenorhabditis angaria TaxID=860376 RepID=A0A9P1IC30_9PELO|nr:unnamed protein product [Caenorhabditis angaria]
MSEDGEFSGDELEFEPLRPPPVEPILQPPKNASVPLDYGRLRRSAEILMHKGCNLQMNDRELRAAIKTAMEFEKSFIALLESKKQQFKILEECFEIESQQCRALLDECKEVLKEKHGIEGSEFENLLSPDELKAKITATFSDQPDTSKPPPNFRAPPPHLIGIPSQFSTPPPSLPHSHSSPQIRHHNLHPQHRISPFGVPQRDPRRIPPFITPPPFLAMERRFERGCWKSRSPPPTRRF